MLRMERVWPCCIVVVRGRRSFDRGYAIAFSVIDQEFILDEACWRCAHHHRCDLLHIDLRDLDWLASNLAGGAVVFFGEAFGCA